MKKDGSCVRNRFSSEIIVLVYCKCRLPEQQDGTRMVQCDKCMEWYHMDKTTDQQIALANKEWYCEMLFYMKSLTMIILTMFTNYDNILHIIMSHLYVQVLIIWIIQISEI